jgi:DNA-binding transcriptional LysR family regulator
MDRLRLIETFVRVVESGSFSAVAREERTTQSAISKQVQALEAQLGVRLLLRSTRQHALTEAGQHYYERCLQVLDTLEEARLEVHRTEHEVSGLVRVASAVAFGRRHIVPRLGGLYARHPRLRVHLALDDAFVDLVEGGIDVAFRIGELKDSRLIARRIGTAHRALVATPDYLARHGEPTVPEDLRRHNCLVYTSLVSLDEWHFVGPGGETRSVRVAGSFESDNSEAILQATLAGYGIAYSPLWHYGDELRAGRVRLVMPDWRPPALPLHVVFQPARRPSLKLKLFVDYFEASFRQDPDIEPALGT